MSLERPVSVLVVPLPQDAESAATLRERARGRASLTDARLLPVYAQGEDGTLLWLATRKLDGRPLSEIDRLEPDRAARLGSQLAAQLAALDESGASPEAIPAESVMLEGAADGERAWLLPDPPRRGLGRRVLGDEIARLASRQPRRRHRSSPTHRPTLEALADELARLSTPATRSRRKLVLGAAVVLAALLVALVAVVAVTRDGSPEADPNAPVGTETAHIPVGAAIAALTVGSDTAWIVTPDGKLVRVDAKTNSVVGAPQPLFPKGSYVDLAPSGSSVWAGGPGKIVRVDPSGKVVETRDLGSRAVSGLLVAGRSLLATVNDGPSPPVRLVRFDPGAKREVVLSEPFGIFAIPVLTSNGTVWAVGGDAAFTEIRAGSTRDDRRGGPGRLSVDGVGPRLDSHPVRPHGHHRRSGHDVARACPSFRGPATDGRGRRRLDVGADEGPEHALPGRPGVSAAPREAVARSRRSGVCEVRRRLALGRRPEVRRARPNRAGDTRPGRSSRRGAG